MRNRLILLALAAAALLTLGTVAPAAATSRGYGPGSGGAQVSATVVTEGGSVTVSGGGFCPGSTVRVDVSVGGDVYQTTSTTADRNGRVSVRITPTETGRHTVTMTGQQADCTGNRVLGVKFTVRPAAAAGAQGPRKADGLADTGGVDLTPLWAGLGLLAAGGLLVSTARTRRRVTV